MPYPELPHEIAHRVDVMRTAAATAFQLQKWEDAVAGLGNVYDFLKEQQRLYQRRFHKGWELHNRGIAFLNLPDFQNGVLSIALAYVEDAISAALDAEAEADVGLAGSMLPGLGVRRQLLEAIKDTVRKRKAAGDIPFEPEEVVGQIAQAPTGLRPPVTAPPGAEELVGGEPKRAVDEIKSPFSRRCFIGGSYFHGGPNLTAIRKMVIGFGFDAIVPDLFTYDPNKTYEICLLLLRQCPKAIFEVTNPGGQLMELERCRDYAITPLLVRHIRSGGDPIVSEMVRTMAGVDTIHPYDETQELEPVIENYLVPPIPP